MNHCMRCTSPASCDIWGCTPLSFPSEKRDPNPQPLTPGQQKILDAVPLREVTPGLLGGAPSKRYDANRSLIASTSTVPATIPSTLSLATLEKLLADIPPEPIGEWMREQGFPPETSLALLPETMRSQLPFWPEYVRFSVDVKEPTLMRSVVHGHQMWQRYRK